MLQLAVTFLVIAVDRRFLRLCRSGGPFMGRGENTLRRLPHPRGTVLFRAWFQKKAFLGVTGERLSLEDSPFCFATQGLKEGCLS